MAEAREDAEHLELALHAHPLEVAPELAEVRRRPAARARARAPSSGSSSRAGAPRPSSTYASRSSDTRS